MATTTTTAPAVYPKLGVKPWRTLRSRAASAPSTKFTPTYVATALGLANPESATNNVVRPLQQLSLIDDQGSLTERGNKWRIDSSYREACQEILDNVYPAELASFTDAAGAPDRTQLTSWFQHQKFGESNARQMAATYAMIAERQVPQAREADQNKPGQER